MGDLQADLLNASDDGVHAVGSANPGLTFEPPLDVAAVLLHILNRDLLETGIVDSVRIVERVLELEQRFGVHLPFEELEIEDFRTVPRLAERIARNTPGLIQV